VTPQRCFNQAQATENPKNHNTYKKKQKKKHRPPPTTHVLVMRLFINEKTKFWKYTNCN